MTKQIMIGVGFGLGLLLVLDALGVRIGLLPGATPHADSPYLWTTSRALGVTAFVALSCDAAFGLFLSTGLADRWIARARSLELHRWLSSATLWLVAMHAILLLGDGFVRFDAIDVLVPFSASYRTWAVGIGILSAYAALAVHLSFAFRSRLGTQTWRRLHYLSFGAYAGGLLHGLLAGSDSDLPMMRTVYLVSGASVALLVIVRISLAAGSVRKATRT